MWGCLRHEKDKHAHNIDLEIRKGFPLGFERVLVMQSYKRESVWGDT
jgi:hypothetical protein